MRLAVDDAIALLDRGAADGLGEMALARTGGNRPVFGYRVRERFWPVKCDRKCTCAPESCGGSEVCLTQEPLAKSVFGRVFA